MEELQVIFLLNSLWFPTSQAGKHLALQKAEFSSGWPKVRENTVIALLLVLKLVLSVDYWTTVLRSRCSLTCQMWGPTLRAPEVTVCVPPRLCCEHWPFTWLPLPSIPSGKVDFFCRPSSHPESCGRPYYQAKSHDKFVLCADTIDLSPHFYS